MRELLFLIITDYEISVLVENIPIKENYCVNFVRKGFCGKSVKSRSSVSNVRKKVSEFFVRKCSACDKTWSEKSRYFFQINDD